MTAAFLALGCTTPKPTSQFTILVPDRVPDGFTVLEADVEAGWCFHANILDSLMSLMSMNTTEPNFGLAVASALREHPGANAMANVKFTIRTKEWLLLREVCGDVVGDVGVLE